MNLREVDFSTWNPEMGWQFLRRSKSYRLEHEKFLKGALKDASKGNIANLDIYNMVNHQFNVPDFFLEQPDAKYELLERLFGIGKRMKEEAILKRKKLEMNADPWTNKREKTLSKMTKRERIKFYDDQKEPGAIHLLSMLQNDEFYAMDLTAKYVVSFFEKFGDIIWLPINPDIEKPRPEVLKNIWMLRPVLIQREAASARDAVESSLARMGGEGLNKRGVTSLNLIINTNFSKNKILKEIERHLSLVKSISKDKKSSVMRKINWKDIDTYIAVWDCYKDLELPPGSFRYIEVGRAAGVRGSSKKIQRDVRTRIDIMREVMSFFER